MNSKLANFALFQIAWFSCAIGVGNDLIYVSVTAVLLVIAIHLYVSKHRRRDSLYLLIVGIFGTAIDSSLGWYGILNYNGHWFCPLWLTGLWMTFASTIQYSLSWLNRRYVAASILGAIAGSGSYYAGASFGAMQLSSDSFLSILVLAIVWGLILPLLFILANCSFMQRFSAK